MTPEPLAHSDSVDVLVVGAGPSGLATAIAAGQAGLRAVVLEKGALVNSILNFPVDMVFFTTPELLEIGGLPFVSPYEKPTRAEALRYYRRVADAHALDVRFDEPVVSIARRADGTFAVVSSPQAGGPHGWTARFVVVATGAFDVPNRIGVPGEDLPHVSHYYREPHPHFRQRVVIVGGKNSAVETALDLYRNGVHVTLVHRGATLGDGIKYWVRPDIENRIRQGSIAAFFSSEVTDITPADVGVRTPDGPLRVPADAVLLLTGYLADTSLLRAAGAAIHVDRDAPVHDPLTYETTVPNLFVAGAVIAGRNSGKVFIENGRFHGAVVVEQIVARLGA